jgi:hypothetical protein
MLASGPFAEFEVVSVDVSGPRAVVLERVGLCGFIGCQFAPAPAPAHAPERTRKTRH